MQKKIKTAWRWLAIVILLVVVIAVSLDNAAAQYPIFYACLGNKTGETAYYKVSWCTRAGYNCTGEKIYYIAPGEILRHSGPRGNGRMYISIYTGGSNGIVKDYSIDGTAGDCDYSSTAVIDYNSRGYLRLYSP
jgi:hypothetical protein